MSQRRKPNNARARLERYSRAVLAQRRVCVVNLDPSNRQGLVDWLTTKNIKHYRALLDTCNPAHLIGSGWIANPSGVSLDEEQADRIFSACGAWHQNEEAA